MIHPVNESDARISIGPFALGSGYLLPEVTVAYATHGRLAADGRNAILVTHGYTASHQMLAHGAGVAEGSWAPLIGPGKPLDTERFFIVCSNILGSSYGTTGPASTDPRSGRPYGHDFPDITFTDIVGVQRRLLERLGVRHLRAVVGPSYGGFQALQWAVDHADMVDAIGVIASAPFFPRNEYTDLGVLQAQLGADPAWRAAAYPGRGQMRATLHALRVKTLMTYGMDAVLQDQGLDAAARAQRIAAMADGWARDFDPGSLVVLLKAGLAFDVRARLHEIRADVLHVIASTDTLFPPNEEHASDLVVPGAKLRYVEMDTPYGHTATGPAHALWSDALRELLDHRT
nr:alpha/beta fold hydrolase [Acidovorax sp. CCYZU-2555]